MPRLDTADLEQKKLPSSSYGYSGARMDDIANSGASEYTIVAIACDVSYSVMGWKDVMEACLQSIVESCNRSPRRDNLMLRLVQFSEQMHEIHGFKMFGSIDSNDYVGCLQIGGATACYDAVHNTIESVRDYAESMVGGEVVDRVNAIVFIITDGLDNRSKLGQKDVKQALADAMRAETLESLNTILVGVNPAAPDVIPGLIKFKEEAGLTQFEKIDEATPDSLAKLAEFASESISSTSNVLGSGSVSKPLSLNV